VAKYTRSPQLLVFRETFTRSIWKRSIEADATEFEQTIERSGTGPGRFCIKVARATIRLGCFKRSRASIRFGNGTELR
jgi:hypothetical protein